jgi:hypothetical protein
MKICAALLTAFATVWLTGCSAVRIETTRDDSYNFASARTYAWRVHPDIKTRGRRAGKATDACIRAAVEANLQRRGVRPAGDARPAIEVAYLVLIEEEMQPYVLDHDWSALRDDDRDAADLPAVRSGLRYGDDDWKWSRRERLTYTYPYEVGTLVVECFHPVTGKTLWRGSILAEVPRSQDPARTRQRICDAVDRLLERFPGE